jgi:hypothetical protein
VAMRDVTHGENFQECTATLTILSIAEASTTGRCMPCLGLLCRVSIINWSVCAREVF